MKLIFMVSFVGTFVVERAEDGAADAHDGRAFQHGRLQVDRHPHRQRVHMDAALDDVLRARRRANGTRCRAGSACGSGIAISPRRRRFGSWTTALARSGSSSGLTPLLVASPLMFTCRQMSNEPSACPR
jgi:hypothetical protein